MILTSDNEFCVVADACVLLPMPLCDTVLRSAEEPSFFRIVWSEEILKEVRQGLVGQNFGYSASQADRRIQKMCAAFPEAVVAVPPRLIDGIQGIPDPGDRHVVALAVQSHADMIVTDNLRHFPAEALSGYNLTALSADDFLVHQYHLNPEVMLEKLDRQAAGIRKRRFEILQYLQKSAPTFCQICSRRDGSHS
jgi:predicted nucleic acid-binding protein